MNWQQLYDRLVAAVIFGVLTWFVITDWFPEERIDSDLVFGAWVAFSTGAGAYLLKKKGRNGDDRKD